jgi:hypothetical protein
METRRLRPIGRQGSGLFETRFLSPLPIQFLGAPDRLTELAVVSVHCQTGRYRTDPDRLTAGGDANAEIRDLALIRFDGQVASVDYAA